MINNHNKKQNNINEPNKSVSISRKSIKEYSEIISYNKVINDNNINVRGITKFNRRRNTTNKNEFCIICKLDNISHYVLNIIIE